MFQWMGRSMLNAELDVHLELQVNAEIPGVAAESCHAELFLHAALSNRVNTSKSFFLPLRSVCNLAACPLQ